MKYRIKIVTGMPDGLPLTVQGIPGSGNQAMDVRVQRKVLPPGVKYGHGPGFSTKMRVAKRPEGLPNGRKKQVVIHPLAVQANGVQHMRHGKDQVVMLHGQGCMHQVVNPESLFGRLAFGTVAVTATVVAVTDGSAALTDFFMAAQRSECRLTSLAMEVFFRFSRITHDSPRTAAWCLSRAKAWRWHFCSSPAGGNSSAARTPCA